MTAGGGKERVRLWRRPSAEPLDSTVPLGMASHYLLGVARSWRACSEVARAFWRFRVFLCRSRVLCVPVLTVALLGIEPMLAAAGTADELVCAGAARGANASAAARPIQTVLLTIVSTFKAFNLTLQWRHRQPQMRRPLCHQQTQRRWARRLWLG